MSAVNLLAIVIFSVLAGILAVRIIKIARRKKLVALRVSQALGAQMEKRVSVPTPVAIALSLRSPAFQFDFSALAPQWPVRILEQSAVELSLTDLLLISLGCALVPALCAYIGGLPELVCLAFALLFLTVPFICLIVIARTRRGQFIDQLPDAIDLMVSVLRSGHSVAQAVRSVGKESAQPLGQEFAHVLQRINLGQPFSEALNNTVIKYSSDELDLIRRAITIQAEVGGSLAELLDKTNLTLRQRLKLKRQVRVLTSQSRLTGIIVGLLPLVLAAALEFLSPGYLEPLVTSDLGRMLLALAVVLEIAGVVLINKMAEVKV